MNLTPEIREVHDNVGPSIRAQQQPPATRPGDHNRRGASRNPSTPVATTLTSSEATCSEELPAPAPSSPTPTPSA
ncbi:unnamed protein product [Cuscuta campestris]|uniref:Uncharacterized protein n=1 Tax=Cuscuta campestris TaxID=132261 RepID=A0A484L8V4_9ASTE|nr:unnamed protein product [Cuscuta campestris]